MTVIASILLLISIGFMGYVCIYLCNDCMTHPIKIGIMQTTEPDGAAATTTTTTTTQNVIFDNEKV